MKKIELDCIVCPMSCHITVSMENDEICSVCGNTCPRGDTFARSEVIAPMRMVTTTVLIHNAVHPLLPVITSQNVLKSKIFDIMDVCKTVEVVAPIHVGDVICENVANSGAQLIASRSMEKRDLNVQSKDTSRHTKLEAV